MNERSPATDTPANPAQAGNDSPTLRRETIVVPGDRGRLGLLIALCSMAGVAVGFGLSNIAIGLSGHPCGPRVVHRVYQDPAPTDTPAWLGVCVGRTAGEGALVARVQPDTPAALAGLEAGDVILGFTAGGPARPASPIATPKQLVERVQMTPPGEYAAVVYRRDGQLATARVHLARMPRPVFEAGPYCSR